MSFESCQTMQFSITPSNGTFSCSISRGFSRLNSVLLTFDGPIPDVKKPMYKSANNLFFPGGDEALDDANPLEIYAQFGTQTYPASVPMRGSQQMFYHLRRWMGYGGKSGNMNISSRDTYLSTQFVTAINFEKNRVADDMGNAMSFTGVSSQAGELLRIYLRGLPASAALAPTMLYVHLIHEEIVEARGDGVTVMI